MEQKENRSQPTGKLFASLRRLRSQRRSLSIADSVSSIKGFSCNEATSNIIPEANEDVTLNEESYPVEKVFTRRRLPLVPIAEDRNIFPESGQKVDVSITQSAKKQHPSGSNLRLRRALQRRSCAPSLMNSESLSPKNANGSKDKVEKTNIGISPTVYSSGGNQAGISARKPQESFAESLGLTFESRLAGRRRSRLLRQEEGSQTSARDEDSEHSLESATKKQTAKIVENEEKANCDLSLLIQSRIKRATSNSIPEFEDMTSIAESSPDEKKLFTRRFPLVPVAENKSVPLESGGKVCAVGTQSAKKQLSSESILRIRRALQRRSCVPSFANTESLCPKNAKGLDLKDIKVEKTTIGISPAAYFSGEIQVSNSAGKPEPFAESRLAGRRRSRLLRQKEGSQTKADEDSKYCHQSSANKQDQKIVENEEKTNWNPSLLSQSRIKEDNQHKINQQAAACGNKSETHVLSTERVDHASFRNNSVKRRRLNRWTPYGSSGTKTKQRDPQGTDIVGQEQDCRRMLRFESDNMSDGGKEFTSPLMIAETPVISRASVLQNPVDQKQLKEVCVPVIKQTLFDHNNKTSRFRRWSTRLHPKLEDTGESYQNKQLEISISGNLNKCESSLDESAIGNRKKITDRQLHHAFGNIASRKNEPVKKSSTDACRSTSSVRKGKLPQHMGSTQKVQRRRSVAVLGLRTPLRRKSANFEVKSSSKANGSTSSTKIPKHRESKYHAIPRKSWAFTNHSSLYPPISNNVVSPDNEGQEEDDLALKDISNDVSLKADASTNTSFNSLSAKHEDMKILSDIETLLKEQEEINIKACSLQKKIAARRLDMKEKKLMESFMTSISPLKRLKALVSKNLVDDRNGLQENPQQCKTLGEDTKCESDAQGPHVNDESEMNWESTKAAPAISDHQTHWRRQQNKRLVRTAQESTPENEEFVDPRQGSGSPFTKLVGDCERPSLAPMTPHSRQHVSQLKISLRKQLEQLYDK